MNRKTKGRNGGNRATLKTLFLGGWKSSAQRRRNGGNCTTLKTPYTRNYNPIRSRIKEIVVRLALYGLLPISAAEWIIQHGGLRDA